MTPSARLPIRALLFAALALAAAASRAGPSAARTSRSIRDFVSCSATDDQRDNAAKAFAAAADNAFTLIVDCPVFIHVGQDIARPIFLESGLDVTMSGRGKFIIDNVFIPTFVIADSDDIQMANWTVEYVGSMPTNAQTGGYIQGGVFKAQPSKNPAAAVFNDQVLTPWLAAMVRQLQ